MDVSLQHWEHLVYCLIQECLHLLTHPIVLACPQSIHCLWLTHSVQFSSVSSVTQSCQTLCNPMNHSTPGLPVHHQVPEFTQSHVHWVGDAIQPSHPLSSLSPAPNTSQHQSFPVSQLFAWGSQSIGVSALASVLPMNTQDWSPLGWTGWTSLQSKGLSRVFSEFQL